MTSPDHYNPGQPNTGWGDVSEMATDFTNNGLIGLMFGGFARGLNGFISALVYGLKGITGGLIDLTGALKATDQKAEQAQNAATGAVQQVAQVTQKIVAFDIKAPTPGWQSINPTEYVSIPRALLFMGVRVTSSGSYFRDDEPDTALKGSTPFLATTQFYVFVRVPVDDELTALNFYAKGSPTALHARVHPMSATGDLLDALTPESPSLHGEVVPSKHTSVSWTFPSPIIVEAGSWVAIAFRCVGTVALAAQELFDPTPPDGFFPIKLSAITGRASGAALPATVAQSALSWTTGTVPYVAIGNNILEVPNKRNLSDNFDRPDTTSFSAGGTTIIYPIGPNWSAKSTRSDSSGMYIRSNAVAWSGGDNGSAQNAWTTPLTTDHVISYIHIGAPQPTANTRFWVSGNADSTSGLGVAFNTTNGITLVARSGIADGTVLANVPAASLPAALAYGDAIELERGEVVGAVFNPDTVLVRHNGIEIIRTTVTAATVPRGTGRRYCGCGVSRTPFQSSTPILDWQAFDVPDVEAAP